MADTSNPQVMPILVGVLMAGATWLIWQNQVSGENARLLEESRGSLDRLMRTAQGDLAQVHETLDSINRRWLARSGTPEQEWREDADRFLTLAECELPEPLARLCDGVAEAEFRLDISSSQLRAAALESADE